MILATPKFGCRGRRAPSGRPPGVRPSPGAASLKPAGALDPSDTAELADGAAPANGRILAGLPRRGLPCRFPALWLLTLCLFSLNLPAQTNPPPPSAAVTNPPVSSAALAQNRYREARARYKQEPANAEAAWQFGRACFDLAEFASNHSERAALAEQGIEACRKAVEQAPKSAPARYYLGMNLGQLARTKGLGALKLVSQMEREFLAARALDEHLDHAGPDRNLGLLYRDAPSIASVGSRSKARQHLQRAVELAPDFPENCLNSIEAYLAWGDRADARRQLEALEAAWPRAQAALTGPAWAASWSDWSERLRKFKQQLEHSTKPLETPRH